MLGLRSWKPERRCGAAEAVARRHIPATFSVKVDPIGHKLSSAYLPSLRRWDTYYVSAGPAIGSHESHNLWGGDVNIRDSTGRLALQVRVLGRERPVIRYDSEAELGLARRLAKELKYTGLYLRQPKIVKGLDDLHIRAMDEL